LTAHERPVTAHALGTVTAPGAGAALSPKVAVAPGASEVCHDGAAAQNPPGAAVDVAFQMLVTVMPLVNVIAHGLRAALVLFRTATLAVNPLPQLEVTVHVTETSGVAAPAAERPTEAVSAARSTTTTDTTAARSGRLTRDLLGTTGPAGPYGSSRRPPQTARRTRLRQGYGW